MVNPNFTEINAAGQLEDPDSVFHYYQKLIRLRKEHEIVVYGTYDLLLPESKEIYMYTRTWNDEKLLVVCNFSGDTVNVELPEEFGDAEILISNYKDVSVQVEMTVRPYEAFVMRKYVVNL